MKKKFAIPLALVLVLSLFTNTAVFAAPGGHYGAPAGGHAQPRIETAYHQPSHYRAPEPRHRAPEPPRHRHHNKSGAIAATAIGALVLGAGIVAIASY